MDAKNTHDLFFGSCEGRAPRYEERLREARRRGTPAWLWPEIQPGAWREALVQLEEAAGAILAGRRPAILRSRDAGMVDATERDQGARGAGGAEGSEGSEGAWGPNRADSAGPASSESALCLAAYTSGLGPWLGWHIEVGRLDADAGAARQLGIHLAHGRARWPALRTALTTTLQALHTAGIQAVVFKGAAAAGRIFPEPGLRPMADVDLLVAGADMDAAERSLARAGFLESPGSRLRRPRRSEWRPPGAPTELRSLLYVHHEDPYAVDLHASLDIDFFGVRTVAFGHPAATHREAAPELGPGASVLSQPLLAAQHAVHASHGLHGLTLIRLVELVLLLRRDMRTAADWSALGHLLRSHGAERFAWPALHLADRLAPGTVQPRLLQQCAAAAPRRLRTVVGSMRPADAQRLGSHALEERFMWAMGPVEHLRRVGDMLVPGTAGGSLRRLGGIYAARAHQLMRGRVSWRAR